MKSVTTIDKLVLAFRIENFEDIEASIKEQTEEVTKEMQEHGLSLPENQTYLFNKTELLEADLKEIRTTFKNNYWVFIEGKRIGLLQWKSYGNTRNYGYFTLCNNTFYLGCWVLYKQMIKDLSLTINNVSKLDIAYDSEIDPTRRYISITKDETNEIVVNGIIIKDRDKILKSPYLITYPSLNNPFKCPEIHFQTKDKSTSSRTYNKTKEIEEHSKKDYITDIYKQKKADKDVYRCEISLNSKAVMRLIETECGGDIERFLEKTESEDYLRDLHEQTMMRLFRYSKNGKGKRRTLLSYYNMR